MTSPSRPSVLIPIAPGTNRNQELADAFHAAGADPVQLPLQALREGEAKLVDHQLLALPGGFSYGDALGAGRLLGLDLVGWFGEQLREALSREMPVIGICNGFQALVRAGLVPGSSAKVALVANGQPRFECRWVTLQPEPSSSVWLSGLTEPLRCPVAHGEGRLVADDESALAGRVAFRYVTPDGARAEGAYPANPNGSVGDVAGLVDATGLVLGLMPHPEDHLFARQDPQRGPPGGGTLPPPVRGRRQCRPLIRRSKKTRPVGIARTHPLTMMEGMGSPETLESLELDLPGHRTGKVRESWELPDRRRLIVTTDPHQRLRSGAGHHPPQGAGAEPAGGLVVRPHRRHRGQPCCRGPRPQRPDRHRRRPPAGRGGRPGAPDRFDLHLPPAPLRGR